MIVLVFIYIWRNINCNIICYYYIVLLIIKYEFVVNVFILKKICVNVFNYIMIKYEMGILDILLKYIIIVV